MKLSMYYKDIAKQLGKSDKMISVIINRLLKEGVIKRVGNGVYQLDC